MTEVKFSSGKLGSAHSNRYFQKENTSDKLTDFLFCEVLPVNCSLLLIPRVYPVKFKDVEEKNILMMFIICCIMNEKGIQGSDK